MTETNEHTKLKELAKNMLINMGFKLDEIHEEYRVEVNSFTKGRNFRVDVCGISKNNRVENIGKAVAIECGQTSAEKLVNLNLFFDEVYQLPYGLKKIDDFDKIYDEAIKEIQSLKEAAKKQQQQIRDLEYRVGYYEELKLKTVPIKILIDALHELVFQFTVPYIHKESTEKLLYFMEENLLKESTG